MNHKIKVVTFVLSSALLLSISGISRVSGLTQPNQNTSQPSVGGENIIEAGTLESAEVVEIRSLVPGQSVVLHVVPDGVVVRKGDLLIQLDDSKLQEQLSIEQINLETAQAMTLKSERQLESITKQLQTTAEIGGLRKKLAELSLELVTANDGEIASESAALQRAIAHHQRVLSTDESTSGIAEAEMELENAKDRLRVLQKYTRPRRQAVAELELALANAEIERETADLNIELAGARAKLHADHGKGAAAGLRVQQVEKNLLRCTMKSPVDGLVMHAATSTRRTQTDPLEEGAVVRERQLLLTIPDVSRLQVRARVHESRIAQVKIGQEVVLEFDALPGRTVKGVVRTVAATPLPGAWPNPTLKEYEIIVAPQKLNPMVRIGMTCLVEIDVP